jgi:3-oxoacyl-[acyl-carrier protein] reductase
MLKSRWGRIVNVGSVVGRLGNPGQGNYVASKAGLEGFTRSLAMEVASRGVTVNAIAPGFIETDMTDALTQEQKDAMLERIPLGRMGEAEEIAGTVGFLCSDQAGYITGQTLHVNGGLLFG